MGARWRTMHAALDGACKLAGAAAAAAAAHPPHHLQGTLLLLKRREQKSVLGIGGGSYWVPTLFSLKGRAIPWTELAMCAGAGASAACMHCHGSGHRSCPSLWHAPPLWPTPLWHAALPLPLCPLQLHDLLCSGVRGQHPDSAQPEGGQKQRAAPTR